MSFLATKAKIIEGVAGTEAALKYLAKQGGKSVTRATMTGAVTPIKKAIRKQVNSATTSQEVKRAARLTIGSSVKKQKDGTYGAKAGLGVGKPSKKKREAATKRAQSGWAGVGLSAANIHWFVLGTKERTQKTTGRATGKIQPVLKGLVPIAVNSARGQMISEAARRAAVAMKREAMKAKQKTRR